MYASKTKAEKKKPHEWKAPSPEEASVKAKRPYSRRFKWEPNIPFIEELASQGMTQEQIASACNITPTWLSVHKLSNADLALAIRRGADRGIAQVSNKLFEAAMKGNVVAAVFYLKARAGWRDNVAIVEMTPEQIAAAMVAHVQATQAAEEAIQLAKA